MINLGFFVIGASYGVLVGFVCWGLSLAAISIIRLVNTK